jgi:putative membrane protein
MTDSVDGLTSSNCLPGIAVASAPSHVADRHRGELLTKRQMSWRCDPLAPQRLIPNGVLLMMFPKSATTMVLSASLMVAPVLAQQAQPVQPAQPARPGVQVQVNPNTVGVRTVPGQAASAPINEHSLAACVAIANQEEVAMAKMATDKAKDKDVKEYAKMLVEDHQGFLKKLERFAPEAQETLQAASASANQSRVQPAGGAAQPQAQAAAQPRQPIQQVAAQAAGSQIDVIQLHREVAQQCLANAKKKMGEMDGDKFDICFIGHQIAKHEEMKTKLTVFQRHASGEFAQLLATGLETTEAHLKKAEDIMKDLDGHKHQDKNEKRDKSDK